MKRALLLLIAPLLVSLAACGAWFAVDGYDANWIDAPADIEHRPRIAYHGTYVYEGADGRYYRQSQNRWVVYRERPRDLGQAEPKREEPKREEPKREEPKREEPKREEHH